MAASIALRVDTRWNNAQFAANLAFKKLYKMEFIEVGFTKKAHSLTGELKVNIEPRYLEDVLKADVVFIETKGTRLPHCDFRMVIPFR